MAEHDEWKSVHKVACELFGVKETEVKFPVKESKSFTLVPAGNHIAICVNVIDLGVQNSGEFGPKHQIYLGFELPTEQMTYTKDDKEVTGPMMSGNSYTASMHEKANLRKFMESWRGQRFTDAQASEFEFGKLLGVKCLLNIGEYTNKAGEVRTGIVSASPVPKGMPSDFTQHNKSLFFEIDEWDEEVFQSLPEWLRKKIDGRVREQEQQDSVEPEYDPEPFDDSPIPF